ncbi:hypothetical protein R75483_07713 [Paraburkholderia domus]|nr:hypothetical protein R75483_07713 [Paraburkholderia domus]
MLDNNNKLLEPELQKWFKKVTNNRELASHIVGVEELTARAEQLKATPRAMETVTREGVIKAVRICAVLADADQLSADRSVAAPGYPSCVRILCLPPIAGTTSSSSSRPCRRRSDRPFRNCWLTAPR